MASHPPNGVLRRFLRGEDDEPAVKEVVPHLLTGCAQCRAALQKELEPPPERGYGPPVRRAFDRVLRRWNLQVKGSKAMVETVRLSLDPAIARRVEGLVGPSLVAALLAESHQLLAENPHQASQVARAARIAASALHEDLYGCELIRDWEARCCAEYGNALRAGDQLAAAEVAFAEALLVLPQGTGDKALEARVHALHASLYGTRRLFTHAEGASDHAIALYLSLGDRHTGGQELITKALYLFYAGRTEEAWAENERGLGLLDHGREPRLVALARYNAILYLVTMGRYRPAELALFQARRVFLSVFGHVDRVKLRWLEARIDAGSQRLERAEEILEEVRDDLSALDMGFAAALATLDLAHVCVERELWEKAEAHAQTAETLFSALGIGREMLAAITVFARSVERRRESDVGVQFAKYIARRAVAFVRRAEHDPEAVFGA